MNLATRPKVLRPVDAVREFNRFYTQQIGVLQEGLLQSQFSLTEVRVLYELSRGDKVTATGLGRELGIDPGYLSRILQSFTRRGMVRKQASPSDRRQSLLSLTRKGRETFAPLDARADREVAGMLENLSPDRRKRLLDGMRMIAESLAALGPANLAYFLRSHRPGDIGWIVQRHGVLYAQEYGWNEEFEALVADIVAKFIRNYDPTCEHCWIAERAGENLGCVLLVKHSKTVAQLRLLLVEPSARGLGLGKRLVEECIRFARQAGYRKIILWTNQVLHAARHIYEQAGFRVVGAERHHSFGLDLVAETWELKL